MLGGGADLFVVSGDITSFGDEAFLDRFISKLETLSVPTFLVPGNNEGPSIRSSEKVINVDGRVMDFGGLAFGGLGGSTPTPFSTPNEYPDSELAHRLLALGQVDVLVTHTPPFGTSLDTAGNGVHLGSRAVREYILSAAPRLVLCGHVHESKSVEVLGSSTCCNPGASSMGGFAIVRVNEDVTVELRSI